MIKSAQACAGTFVTKDSDGLLSAATVGPTGTLYVNGVADGAAVTITGSNPYKWAVTLPTLSAGDVVQIYITATVATVATGGIVWSEVADTKLVSDLNDIAAGALMGLANDAITSAKFDESSAFPLAAADAGATQVARVGADADTLETLSDQLDTAQADLDNPNQYKADVSGLATALALAAHDGKLDIVDGNIDTLLSRITEAVATAAALAIHDGKLDIVDGNIDTLLSRVTEAVATAAALVAHDLKLDTADANIDTILSRVTAAVATAAALAILDAKAASILDDTGTSGVVLADNAVTAAKIATDALGALELAQGAVDEIADGVWGHDTRTLTQSAAAVTAAVAGSVLTILRGDTWKATITALGALTGYTSLDITIKKNKHDIDDNAIIRIRKNASGLLDGLLRLNGAAVTDATKGSIAIDNAGLGNITVTLDATEAAKLAIATDLYYDIQLIRPTGVKVQTVTEGKCNITGDITRAVI